MALHAGAPVQAWRLDQRALTAHTAAAHTSLQQKLPTQQGRALLLADREATQPCATATTAAPFLGQPNDPAIGQQWGLRGAGVMPGAPGDPFAWSRETGSRDVLVCVIDSGIDTEHPDLRANLWVNEAEIPGNGIDDDDNGVALH